MVIFSVTKAKPMCLCTASDEAIEAAILAHIATLAKAYLGLVDPPDDRSPYTLVVMIDDSGVHRYEEKQTFEAFTPLNQNIYAIHDGVLWKWTGSSFEAVATGLSL